MSIPITNGVRVGVFNKHERARLECLKRRAEWLEQSIARDEARIAGGLKVRNNLNFMKQEASSLRWALLMIQGGEQP